MPTGAVARATGGQRAHDAEHDFANFSLKDFEESCFLFAADAGVPEKTTVGKIIPGPRSPGLFNREKLLWRRRVGWRLRWTLWASRVARRGRAVL